MALSASQRIELIREITKRLVVEDYSLVDLTLRQFALPWTDVWDGSKESYVIQMVEGASDGVLLELARHVGFDLSAPTNTGVDPPFWRQGMFRVFISHLATERKLAADLQTAFLRYGISCFVAHNDIEPTLEWQGQIETALTTCDALIALLHPDFHSSYWTDQEIGFAMGRGVATFAVRLGQDPYGFIGRFQAFNGHEKSAAVITTEIFEAYCKNKQRQRRMAQVQIGLFSESNSFSDAKDRIYRLEQLPYWEPEFSSRIDEAVKSNGQISGSWGVPQRVAKLINKWKG